MRANKNIIASNSYLSLFVNISECNQNKVSFRTTQFTFVRVLLTTHLGSTELLVALIKSFRVWNYP